MKFLRAKTNFIFKNEFYRHVVTLVGGAGGAQAITLVFFPILSRLFGPKDFGLLASYTAIVGICSSILCGRYEYAIVLPKKDSEAVNITCLSFCFAFIISLFTIPVFCFWAKGSTEHSNYLFASNWIYLIPFNLMLVGGSQALSYWNLREKNFQIMSLSRLASSIFNIVVSIFIALLIDIEGGLLFAYFFSGAVSFLVLLGGMRSVVHHLFTGVNFYKIQNVAKRYRKFPIYGLLPSFFDSFTLSMPVLFLNSFFGTIVSGHYAICMKALQFPMNLIGNAVSQVFHQRVAKLHAAHVDISEFVTETFKKLFFISVPIFFIMICAPLWFGLVFGSQWEEAGWYAVILAPAITLRFIVSPLSVVFGVVNRQEIAAIWKGGAFASTGVCLGGSLVFLNPKMSLVCLMLNDLFIYSIYLYFIFKVTNVGGSGFLLRKTSFLFRK